MASCGTPEPPKKSAVASILEALGKGRGILSGEPAAASLAPKFGAKVTSTDHSHGDGHSHDGAHGHSHDGDHGHSHAAAKPSAAADEDDDWVEMWNEKAPAGREWCAICTAA
jgi:hypothetical protein